MSMRDDLCVKSNEAANIIFQNPMSWVETPLCILQTSVTKGNLFDKVFILQELELQSTITLFPKGGVWVKPVLRS